MFDPDAAFYIRNGNRGGVGRASARSHLGKQVTVFPKLDRRRD
jgi:hypothetical protein